MLQQKLQLPICFFVIILIIQLFLYFTYYNLRIVDIRLFKMGCYTSSETDQLYRINSKFPKQLFIPTKILNNPQSSPNCEKQMPTSRDILINQTIAYYEDIISNRPSIKYPFDALGNIQDAVGVFDGSEEEWYLQGRQCGFIQGNPYDALSLCYSLKDDCSLGQRFYQEMISKQPKIAELYFGLGNICYKMGLYEQAERAYRSCIDINPRLDKAYQNIANIYCFKLYDNKQAEEWAKFTLKINPNNKYAQLIKILTLQNSEQRTPQLQKLLAKHQNYTRIHNALGYSFLECNQPDHAIQWFLKGLKISPNYYALHCGLAIAYNKVGKLENAKQSSQKALELNPMHHQPYFSMGECFLAEGRKVQAESWYLKCLQRNENFHSAYLELARIQSLKSQQKALSYYQKYFQLIPDNPDALIEAAKICLSSGRNKKLGEKLALQAIEISEKHQKGLYLLGKYYKQTGREEKAVPYLQRYLQVGHPKMKGVKMLIEVYEHQNELQKAEEVKRLFLK